MDLPTFNILSLCSGVHGQDLGLDLAVTNARTVCSVDIEAHACAVMVSRFEDKTLAPHPVWTDLKTFDGRKWRGLVDCITGGYPCQPFSVAGKRKAADDPRHLWPFIARIVEEVWPRQCFFENVANHLNLGFYEVARDLQGMGYQIAAGLFTAEEVGAPHKRERLFILADRITTGRGQDFSFGGSFGERTDSAGEKTDWVGDISPVLAHSFSRGLEEWRCESGNDAAQCATFERSSSIFPPGPNELDLWAEILEQDLSLAPALSETEAKSAFRGMADGFSGRMDRLSRCGNGCVPLVAAYAYCLLSEALENCEGSLGD